VSLDGLRRTWKVRHSLESIPIPLDDRARLLRGPIDHHQSEYIQLMSSPVVR
jgi:hypothetical protein